MLKQVYNRTIYSVSLRVSINRVKAQHLKEMVAETLLVSKKLHT